MLRFFSRSIPKEKTINMLLFGANFAAQVGIAVWASRFANSHSPVENNQARSEDNPIPPNCP